MKIGINYLTESMYFRKPLSEIQKDLQKMRKYGFEVIRLTGDKLPWLMQIAKLAKKEKFEVWLCPRFADYLPMFSSLQYLNEVKKFASAVEKEDIDVFIVGNELSLELKDFAEIQGYENRCDNWKRFQGEFQERKKLFNEYLKLLAKEARKYFSGPITYAAGAWELDAIDWQGFDIVSANLYLWQKFAKEEYTATLKKLKSYGKPVAITEFGFTTTREAWKIGPGHIYGLRVTNWFNKFLMSHPTLVKFILTINPKILLKVKFPHHYDEETQMLLLQKNLNILAKYGVDAAIVHQWSECFDSGFGLVRLNGKPKLALSIFKP